MNGNGKGWVEVRVRIRIRIRVRVRVRVGFSVGTRGEARWPATLARSLAWSAQCQMAASDVARHKHSTL